jgi:hypothetical protein
MDLQEAIAKRMSSVPVYFYATDGHMLQSLGLTNARQCREWAGYVAARCFSIHVCGKRLWYDATGRFLGDGWANV